MKRKIINSYRKQKRRLKKQSKFFVRHPYVIPISVFVVLFFTGLALFVMLGATTQGAADAHIVDVYVDGEHRTVTTRAHTVGELLERLQVEMIDEDIIEPSENSLILEDNTQVNIYRARPVKVVDGDRTITLLTAQRAPRLVAIEAGLKLYLQDEVTFKQLETNVLESSVSEQLSIIRSIEVKLSIYGAVKVLRTTAVTVGDLLEQHGVSPEEDDTVEPRADTALSEGALIALNRPGVKTVAINEVILFETERRDDNNLTAGQSKVEQEGADGERAVIYEVIEEEGIEVDRRLIREVVVREPVPAIILRGTKIVSPAFSPSVTVAGDKAALMSAAGIAQSDYGFVDFIVSHESGWRPGAASSTGAYGLCQSLPASKMASAGSDYLTNPVTQLRWCSGYASGRYGSWGGAYNAWLAQGWW